MGRSKRVRQCHHPNEKGAIVFRFERLAVWQKAIEIFELVVALVECLPHRVRFGLADQMHRAALSISSKIAEGSGRETVAEMRYFYTTAKASTFELVSLSIICHRRKFFTDDQYSELYRRAEGIARMLTALKKRPCSTSAALESGHQALGTRR
jgi:four helix bundle protein